MLRSLFPTALVNIFFASSLKNASASDLILAGGGTENGWKNDIWSVGVDGVMGGKSTGFLSYDNSDATMRFYGTINLNGGGFASAGKSFQALDLQRYAGIIVAMETEYVDGSTTTAEKPFGFHLQLGDFSAFGYAAAFAAPLVKEASVETSVFLPMKKFDIASFFGYTCKDCILDSERINEMEIYALFQEGDFSIKVKSITAVEKPQSFRSPTVSFQSSDEIESLIEATISAGSTLYDTRYYALCFSIYWSMLNTLIEASSGVSDALKNVVCTGVRKVSPTGEYTENVRTLRYTLNAVLADLKGVDRDSDLPSWLPDKGDTSTTVDGCTGYTSIPAPEMDLHSVGEPQENSSLGELRFNESKLFLYCFAGFVCCLLL